VLITLLIWKMGTELFYPQWEAFEWIERGASYGSILGLYLLLPAGFSPKYTFDGTQHRTTRLNEAIRVFTSLKADFGAKNKGKPVDKTNLPSKVAGSRIELPTSGL
jgi:hypothetical protein